MSDNEDNPMDFPESDTEYYPEVGDEDDPMRLWAPESLAIMAAAGFGPEDCNNEYDSEEEEEEETPPSAVRAQRAGIFTIKLPVPKPSSKARASKPASKAESHCKPTSKAGKLATTAKTTADVKKPVADLSDTQAQDAPSKRKKQAKEPEAESEQSDTESEDEATRRARKKKKRAHREQAEQQDSEVATEPPNETEHPNDSEEPAPPPKKKRGRPRKPVEAKPASTPAGEQAFNTAVFVSIEQPPQLQRGRTHKSDKLIAQDPRVEGPFTLTRSMKWAEFIDEVAGWVGVEKENLRVSGLSWAFQKQKDRLPLSNEHAFKTLREQVKAKHGSATVIFIHHPISKKPQSRDHRGSEALAVVDQDEDESRWGKKLSLDDKLAPVIAQLQDLYPVGRCSDHPDIRCFNYPVRTNEFWHYELNAGRLSVWANAIIRKDVDYERAPVGKAFFLPKDRIQSRNTQASLGPQTPGPPGANAFGPNAAHLHSWSPNPTSFYPSLQYGGQPSTGLMPPPGSFQFPTPPYYPFPQMTTPFGFGSPTQWGYPQHTAIPPSPQTPLAKIPPQNEVGPAAVQHPMPTASSKSFPETQDLKEWCLQHALGEVEYQGLLKLGFRVGNTHELADLPSSVWEWAGIAPLPKMRIMAACAADSGSLTA